MGNVLSFLLGVALVIIVCRVLASAFPVIKTIVVVLVWIAAVVMGCVYGFWAGLFSFIGAASVSGILFGVGEDENGHSVSRGMRCPECGSRDVGTVEDGDAGRVTGYACGDCGHFWQR